MTFPAYTQSHPDRLAQLNQSEDWLAKAGDNPIYMHKNGKLLDIYTICSLVTLYGGSVLNSPVTSIISYLKSAKALRHAEDRPARFDGALNELKELYAADKKDYLSRQDPDDFAPFFVHPETAFGFMRYHLRASPQMYGQPLTLNSLILPVDAQAAMAEAFDKMEKSNFYAWYFAVNNVSVKLRAVKTFKEDNDSKVHLDVYAQMGSEPPFHARQPLETEDGVRYKMPSLAEVMKLPDIVKFLPKIA